MYVNAAGLVLRETPYKDSSKILTVLTSGEGKLTVSARGALRRNSKLTAVTQLLAFSEMTLYRSRDRWTLTEARSVEQFIGLREDIALLALGAYFAELTEAVADEDSPSPELLPLILNALFALSERIKAPAYVKPAFELRLMAASGFAPLIGRCAACGAGDLERAVLDFSGGTVRCARCGPAEPPAAAHQSIAGCAPSTPTAARRSGTVDGPNSPVGAAAPHASAPAGSCSLGRGALAAARYIIGCDAKKLFSFELGDAALRELSSATEGYLLAQLDRGFRTLDYYYAVCPLSFNDPEPSQRG